MGLKKSFAKKANSYQRSMKNYLSEADILFVIPPAILGAALGFGSSFAIDTLKPLDNQPHMGQEIAVQQHQAALTQLEQQHKALQDAQSAAHFTPQSLGEIIPLTEEDQSNKGSAIEIQKQYESMLDAFVTSVHVDKRLNEADAKSLMEAFEATHGDIEEVTSFTGLDYNDLDEARAWAGEPSEAVSEKELAQSINKYADQTHEQGTSLMIGGGAAVLPFLISILFAMMGGPLRRWETETPKPTKPGKYTH
jgi:hypothetical protein